MRSLMQRPVLLVVLALMICGGRVSADGAPSPAVLKQARAHFLQGKAFQDAKAYDQAIGEYDAAYALVPLPDLIFNLAQCYRLKGEPRTALADYRRYLDAAPDGRGAEDARRFVASLTQEVAAEDAAEAAAAAAKAKEKAEHDEAERKRVEAERAEAERRAAASSGANGAKARNGGGGGNRRQETGNRQPAKGSGRRGRGLRIAGLVSVGVGGVMMGAGALFGIKASSAAAKLDELVAGKAWDQGLYDDGKAAERNMVVLIAVGSAAVVGGGVLYLLGRRAGRERTTVSAAPLPGGGAAFGVAGRF